MNCIPISEKDLEKALIELPEWKYLPDIPALHAVFQFNTFLQAIEFMHKASLFIDELNHHPEWTNIYNTVKITLYTHDIKAISTLDIELAKYLDDLYKKL